MSIKVFRVKVVVPADTTFRKHSAKKAIMTWCLEHQEFTKAEFLTAVAAMRDNGEVESVMSSEICARAWWNELYNKYKYLVDCE